LELDVLGVHRKLVKYVVHLCKKKNEKNLFFFTQAAQTVCRSVFGFKEF
jgi:hypothetical protein